MNSLVNDGICGSVVMLLCGFSQVRPVFICVCIWRERERERESKSTAITNLTILQRIAY